MVVSMRLHSIILALTHHIPFVAVSYSQKTNMLLNEISWDYAHTSDAKADDILESMNTIEKNYSALSKKLAEEHEKYQSHYTHYFP